MKLSNRESERVKDLAAKAWHKKPRNKAALADVFAGATYSSSFALHQVAFVAGYLAGRAKAGVK